MVGCKVKFRLFLRHWFDVSDCEAPVIVIDHLNLDPLSFDLLLDVTYIVLLVSIRVSLIFTLVVVAGAVTT